MVGHIEQIESLRQENEELRKRVDALEKQVGSKEKKEQKEGKIAEHKLLHTEAR